jgi:hypothetical protein
MAEDELGATLTLPRACPDSCNKPPFSAFTLPLYVVFRGRWPDLAHGVSGAWALGPKLWFPCEVGTYFIWCGKEYPTGLSHLLNILYLSFSCHLKVWGAILVLDPAEIFTYHWVGSLSPCMGYSGSLLPGGVSPPLSFFSSGVLM